jgi:hypothetical protein
MDRDRAGESSSGESVLTLGRFSLDSSSSQRSGLLPLHRRYYGKNKAKQKVAEGLFLTHRANSQLDAHALCSRRLLQMPSSSTLGCNVGAWFGTDSTLCLRLRG